MRAVLVVVVFTVIAAAQQTATPGMYVDQHGTLLQLTPASYSGTRASNHVVKANLFWTFRGSRSATQLSMNRPHFRLVCGRGSVALVLLCGLSQQPSDLIIVRLDEKSDHRESRMATGSVFGGRGGFDPKKTTKATAVKHEDGGWDVSPDEDLEPGEYLVTSSTQPQGFEFSVRH